jgi:hypothetical protein
MLAAARRSDRLLARDDPALRRHVRNARPRDRSFGRSGDRAEGDGKKEIEVHTAGVAYQKQLRRLSFRVLSERMRPSPAKPQGSGSQNPKRFYPWIELSRFFADHSANLQNESNLG